MLQFIQLKIGPLISEIILLVNYKEWYIIASAAIMYTFRHISPSQAVAPNSICIILQHSDTSQSKEFTLS